MYEKYKKTNLKISCQVIMVGVWKEIDWVVSNNPFSWRTQTLHRLYLEGQLVPTGPPLTWPGGQILFFFFLFTLDTKL